MRRLLPLTLMIGFFLLPGCQQQNPSEQPPHLMTRATGAKPAHTPGAEELRMAHEERLARIEAEKARALKALELQRSKSIEEIRARTREIEAQNALKLAQEKQKYAQLIAQKEERLKTLEAESARRQAEARERVAQLETRSRERIETLKGRYAGKIASMQAELKNRYLIAAVLLTLLAMIIGVFLYRYRRKSRQEERREEREHEMRMLANRQQHERFEKILEIIASSSTDKEIKGELIRLLRQGALDPNDPRLIEYKQENEKLENRN